ncbi:MAG: NAD(P)H-dependent oxidoreductase subunit E [Candidatus Aminicenantes bacterium]|nr:NAD(P)H-dependent oxidoreductase subunit E [Candidatus Aminicenantes bacterium]
MKADASALNTIMERWQNRKDFLIEILQDIQDEYSFLPAEVLGELSNKLEIPLNQIYEAATYYKAFSLEPKGRFQINVCQGTACHVRGASAILNAFERDLKIKAGETDGNKDFTLDIVRCIGCCALAPVLTVNEDVHAKFDPSLVPKTLKKYRKMSSEESKGSEGS